MKTIIAEKPSVAREIARIVGATKREEGYFEGGGYAVTWAFGHLVQLAMPDGYGIRGFVRDNLPVIPDTFTLVPRQTKTEKGYKPDSGVAAQIKVIATLFNRSEQIIVATDAGREGELIFRYLYHYIGCTTPFVRLWISSLTDKAIREGLRNLEAGGKYDNLYLAAKARSESDWLVGINGTQALSIAAGHAKHGFTAEQTLEIAQKLYEKKLITYPRTGSRYIPEDMFAEIPKLLAFIGALPEWKGKVQPKAQPTRRSVDGGKVTDHHALLVTGEKPLFLSKEDSTIYQMVAGRMIEAFSEKCVKDTATVTAECAGVEFTVKGSIIRQAGWRAVYGGEDKEETAIPDWREGDTLTLKGCSITEGKTKPKPLHTEATLLSAMETAGKDIEDDALRQALKDCGIGTPATRAAIIETLFKRGYMERCKKSLVPTEKGLALYSVVKTMRIADVAMTGEWEKNLARIERGELPADTFRREIEAYTREITSELLSCDKLFSRRDSGCKCPKCGTGSMQFYGKVVRCDNAECGLPVFRLKANRTLSDDEIKELLTDGHTKLLKGFKSKQGKSFDAIVAFDGDYNTTFVFPERKTSRKFSGRKK